VIGLSFGRLAAVMVKEFTQMRRDRLTFAMIVGIPILQLVLFGYAINADPKQLPAATLIRDHGPFSRAIVAALENSAYFRIVGAAASEAEAEALLAEGRVQFVIDIGADFSRRIQRGERPAILVAADATDPAATGNAVAALTLLAQTALNRDLTGALAAQVARGAPFEVVVHRRYNPEGLSQYNVVPGLIGTILTMTMIMMTALAVTRERERGTMENLLATPVTPFEVMVGKIVPYIVVGMLQVGVILVAARFLFAVPMMGDAGLLAASLLLFIAANLAVGFTFSTIAANQLQAMQMTFFFFLPSMLLSGFMFPFRGMPQWAQVLGEILPLTHFLRVVRGILLKGNGFHQVAADLAAVAAFLLAAGALALLRYRRTLD
jgi:ABC-2 type transport system permease protein